MAIVKKTSLIQVKLTLVAVAMAEKMDLAKKKKQGTENQLRTEVTDKHTHLKVTNVLTHKNLMGIDQDTFTHTATHIIRENFNYVKQ